MRSLILPCLLLLLSRPCQAQRGGLPPSTPQTPRLDRLMALASHLETIDPASFNMFVWGTSDDPYSESFVGCAAGHATHLFAADGFRLHELSGKQFVARYGDHYGIHACESFFGLSYGEACLLFGACDRTSREEAEALRSFVGRRLAVAMVMR